MCTFLRLRKQIESDGRKIQKKMTQKTFKFFIVEIYSKPPKKKWTTNKTKVHHNDDLWSLDILDFKDYGEENNRSYRYVLVVIDNFSKFAWTVVLKNKSAQTIKDFFEKNITSSKKQIY